MNVKIEIIPHDQQRYPTVGDWIFDENGDLTIRVSKLSDWRREMLVAIHELAEVMMCKHTGVTQKAVDDFDMNFEANRKPGDESEPGDDPKAPYFRQHVVASAVERLVSHEMEVDWEAYADELEAMP